MEGNRVDRAELPPVRYDTVRHFLADIKKHKIKLPDKKKGELWAARYRNGRTVPFRSLAQLIKRLQTYESIKGARGRAANLEEIRNIEIVTIPDTKAGKARWAKAKAADRKRKK